MNSSDGACYTPVFCLNSLRRLRVPDPARMLLKRPCVSLQAPRCGGQSPSGVYKAARSLSLHTLSLLSRLWACAGFLFVCTCASLTQTSITRRSDRRTPRWNLVAWVLKLHYPWSSVAAKPASSLMAVKHSSPSLKPELDGCYYL